MKQEIKQESGTLSITIRLEQQYSDHTTRSVPWKKIATRNARALLLEKGLNPGEVVTESCTINNAAAAVAGTWVFVDLDASAPPPEEKEPPKKSRRSSRKKTTTKAVE